MTSRRKFLTVLGAGVILAAGAGTAWVTTRAPAQAIEPWSRAGVGTNPIRGGARFLMQSLRPIHTTVSPGSSTSPVPTR